MADQSKCALCGEPMPAGEEMFNFHGYSGACPKPPLPKRSADELAQDEFHVLRILGNGQISAEKARELIAQIRDGRRVKLMPLEATNG